MAILSAERELLRDLAFQVKDIAQNPVWQQKDKLWLDKNSLRRVRPLILCSLPDQAWKELIPLSSLSVQDPPFRKYEWELKKNIYRWENLKDDEIITDRLYVPISHSLTDWIAGRVRPFSEHPDEAARFCPSIVEYSDLGKARFPQLTVDWPRAQQQFELVQDVFGDILQVILGEPYYAGTDSKVMGWGNSLIDILCELRGIENLYLDLHLAPEFVHEAMAFLLAGTLKYLDDMEKQNLLRPNNNAFICAANTPLGSNGLGITNELPRDGFDPDRVTTQHLWGYFQAQEFTGVSPHLLEEFVLPYQARIAERFGLNCYGCCELNDRKWDRILKRIPRLRELSVSHASSLEIAAERLSDKYVLSWKPHPVEMITMFEERRVRAALQSAFEITKKCCMVVCLRDIQTLSGEPERAAQWMRITLEEADK